MEHAALLREMIAWEAGCAHRAQHLLKVHGFAAAIAALEELDRETTHILEAAALVHDIGIRPALERYGSDSGKHQEELGPPQAEALLLRLGYREDVVRRVCRLVGRHHTYTGIDGPDCQILIEADFLVNLLENGSSREAVQEVRERIFRTGAGLRFLDDMFLAGG